MSMLKKRIIRDYLICSMMRLMLFVGVAVLEAAPVMTVPPGPALLPPVFELEVVVEFTVALLFTLMFTGPGHSQVVPIFVHLNLSCPKTGTARNEMSTENESVCASFPSASPSHPIAAVRRLTVKSPAHQVIPM